MIVRVLGLLLLLAGCRQILGFEPVETPTDSAPDTLVIPDAGACTEVSATCVVGTVLRSCAAIGDEPIDTLCSWGCLDVATPHCAEIDPTGSTVTTADVAPDSLLLEQTILNSVTIDAATGSMTNVRAGGPGIINGIDFEMRNNLGILRFRSVRFAGPVTVTGAVPLVIVANGAIVIENVVDARGGCATTSGGPGGSAGGTSGNNGSGVGRGTRGDGAGPVDVGGGGGAGYGGGGGVGGDANSAQGGAAGAAFGNLELLNLIGGSGGGGGARAGEGGNGGGGGGAIFVVSNTEVRILGGGINAGGCGGRKGQTGGGGGGGGSGGAILIEAPIVILDGGLAVNGGGGGSGNGGGNGDDALLSPNPAGGGTSVQGGEGGNGGAAGDLSGKAGVDDTAAGGGGGGVGRIRINTRDGTVTINTAGFTSPALASSASSATSGIAVVK